MNVKVAVKIFDNKIRHFAKKKEKFCACPQRDFTRNRKQNFENVIESVKKSL